VSEFLAELSDQLEDLAPEAVKKDLLSSIGEPISAASAFENLHKACFEANTIRVIDWGHGMNKEELQSSYLTIGTPSRLKQKIAIIDAGTGGRVPLGEKGIGRLAAMRLGHFVTVLTTKKDSSQDFRLELDWRPVFSNPDLDASELNFEPKLLKTRQLPKPGTTLVIQDIQSDWSLSKLQELADSDLGKLADPFASGFANQFIKVFYQGKEQNLITAFHTKNLEQADAECTISFRAGSIVPRVPGSVSKMQEARLQVSTKYTRFNKSEVLLHEGAHLADRVSHLPGGRRRKNAGEKLARSDEVVAALASLGDFEAKFYWFNRGRLIREERDLWRDTLEKFVRGWSGGLLVYRDGFRVYPYGSAGDDWLDLDRRALASSAYKLNRAQIVGYLRVSSAKNGNLQDQTNREGFRDCPEKEALRRLLRQAIIADCKTFLEKVDKQIKGADEETIKDIDERIADSSDLVVASLRGLRDRVPTEAETVQAVLHELAEVQDAWERAKQALSAKDSEVEKYAHLAGVGLMVELLAHELARSTEAALDLLEDKKTARDPAKLQLLTAVLKTLDRRIRVIDELSIPGRQRKALHDIGGLVKLMNEFYQSKLDRHHISLSVQFQPKASFTRRVEKGQILQILDNLLSNSVYWLSRRLERDEAPTIKILVATDDGKIEFSDNGPGIPASVGEKVFDPFYSTKPEDGRGLGLYITRRLAKENDMTVQLLPAIDGKHRGFKIQFAEK
jgi:signal transduction histidine kinase